MPPRSIDLQILVFPTSRFEPAFMYCSARHRQDDRRRPHGIVWKRGLVCLLFSACWGTLGRDASHLSPSPFPFLPNGERLEEGKSFQRSLTSTESQTYELSLTAGQYF